MTLYVVGLGPGAGAGMTAQARAVLEACQVIVGYTAYINLVRADYPNKELLSTPMRSEVERCRMAIERAASGEDVAMVCSGDPGVYGMASLCLELAEDHPALDIEVIPGVTAATSGAALLGAPLTHDFAVISLSDLLTPWETIERRLSCAAKADFVICLYNPASRKRTDHLRRACDVLLRELPATRCCGVVRNIGREGEQALVLTLGELREYQADMFTTVFIGNQQTRVIRERLVTPRGYLQRED